MVFVHSMCRAFKAGCVCVEVRAELVDGWMQQHRTAAQYCVRRNLRNRRTSTQHQHPQPQSSQQLRPPPPLTSIRGCHIHNNTRYDIHHTARPLHQPATAAHSLPSLLPRSRHLPSRCTSSSLHASLLDLPLTSVVPFLLLCSACLPRPEPLRLPRPLSALVPAFPPFSLCRLSPLVCLCPALSVQLCSLCRSSPSRFACKAEKTEKEIKIKKTTTKKQTPPHSTHSPGTAPHLTPHSICSTHSSRT